ncbi:MAG: hypothetical protein QOG23_4975 [Blastocatellia bacterium]|jgi:hypothetical protein|nr:hypothetical protein [Blastocatellia bacterium]
MATMLSHSSAVIGLAVLVPDDKVDAGDRVRAYRNYAALLQHCRRTLTHPSFPGYFETMKEIVVKIDDEAYQRAQGIANGRNISLSTLVEELMDSLAADAQPNSDDINNLFSTLDKGRNTDPIGRLGRSELHDRPVLHRY